MNQQTRETVHGFLKAFTQESLTYYDIEKLKRGYPFHQLFFNEEGLLAFKRERSIVTKMGQALYPKLAEIIAREKYKQVELEKNIQGNVEKSLADKINEIVQVLRAKRQKPNHAEEIESLNKLMAKRGTSKQVALKVIADIYIGDFQPGPFFAEIKSPLPNLDVCAQTKSKILIFETLMAGKSPRGYLAFPYNPHVTRQQYKHSFTKQIMDMEAEVLIAEEFWDKIGGEGTFDELLSIIEAVGSEVRSEQAG